MLKNNPSPSYNPNPNTRPPGLLAPFAKNQLAMAGSGAPSSAAAAAACPPSSFEAAQQNQKSSAAPSGGSFTCHLPSSKVRKVLLAVEWHSDAGGGAPGGGGMDRVGRMDSCVPGAVAAATQALIESLTIAAARIASKRGDSQILPGHVKQAVDSEDVYALFRDVVADAPTLPEQVVAGTAGGAKKTKGKNKVAAKTTNAKRRKTQTTQQNVERANDDAQAAPEPANADGVDNDAYYFPAPGGGALLPQEASDAALANMFEDVDDDYD